MPFAPLSRRENLRVQQQSLRDPQARRISWDVGRASHARPGQGTEPGATSWVRSQIPKLLAIMGSPLCKGAWAMKKSPCHHYSMSPLLTPQAASHRGFLERGVEIPLELPLLSNGFVQKSITRRGSNHWSERKMSNCPQ